MYEVKHAYPQAEQRWFEVAKGDAQWKGKMVHFLGCQVGRAFKYCTEEILARD